VISVVSELLERAGVALSKSHEMKQENFDACHPDGGKSEILSIMLTA